MTKKNTKKSTDKDSSKNNVPEKFILSDLVDSQINRPGIMGALSYAGLLEQYQYEKRMKRKEEFEPSITQDELDEHIKNFLGE